VINTDAPISSFNQMVGNPKFEFSVRPRRLIGETISMNAIIDYEVQRTGDEFFFMTHTTNPLLSSLTINAMLDEFILKRESYDSVISVTKFYGRFFDKTGEPLNHNPAELVRTQDLDPVLFENSCGYVFSESSFKKKLSRIGDKPLYFTTPKLESIDIDDEDDWIIASALLRVGDENV
jgi:CMP-N-acetylneuraminic acid synthetase